MSDTCPDCGGPTLFSRPCGCESAPAPRHKWTCGYVSQPCTCGAITQPTTVSFDLYRSWVSRASTYATALTEITRTECSGSSLGGCPHCIAQEAIDSPEPDDDEAGVTLDSAPLGVIWRAFVVTGPGVACWPCFEHNATCGDAPYVGCTHDPLTSPWPPSSPTAEPPERRR